MTYVNDRRCKRLLSTQIPESVRSTSQDGCTRLRRYSGLYGIHPHRWKIQRCVDMGLPQVSETNVIWSIENLAQIFKTCFGPATSY